MGILVVADHDNAALQPATLNTIAAAAEIGGDIAVLVAGSGSAAVAEEAAKVAGVSRVLHADAAELGNGLAENIAPTVVAAAEGMTHVLAPATTYGKNLLPRVGALMDVQPISDISAIVSSDTFERPIYAGNAIATVQSTDSVKVVTVRATSFEAAAAEGGSATVRHSQARVMRACLHLSVKSFHLLTVQN